ncbi:MAG: glycosyltransferase family 4 protein [Burkholderiales bacterium]
MKPVILLSHGFQSEYEIGFANGLARRGIAVTLIASDSTFASRAVPGVEIVNLRGSQDPRRPALAKLANMLGYLLRYPMYLLAHRGAPVHVIGQFSTRSTWVALAEAWVTRVFGGAFVLTLHNLLPHERHSRLNHWIFQRIVRAPARLVVHTPRMARLACERYGLDPARVAVMEHGFDRPLAGNGQGGREDWRARHEIPPAARVALMFGMVARYKGPDVLLEAFAQAAGHDDLYLVIAGHCRESKLRNELHQAIAAHPCRSRIRWSDAFVADAEVPALLAAADCMVLAHRHVDQSGVLFAALSAGLPFVASDVGSFADYRRDGIDEIVPAGDGAALAQAMLRCLRRPEPDRQALARAAAARWDWRETTGSVVQVYREVFGEVKHAKAVSR